MKRPILFNGDMVRSILAGQKTQTRRPVDPQRQCPFGQPGDRLWVRETFCKYYPSETWPEPKALYRADGITLCATDSEGKKQRWTPSIHMPRTLSRITLEITDVRVERVRDISEEEARAEGIEALDGRFVSADLYYTARRYGISMEDARCIYAHLWDTLYAARGLGWGVNPWVWVVTFKILEGQQCPKN
ncbi:hypothetical protein [uncultured Desulfovibrio sp.]|uniref:hypothetical protein n=1 Tax=uncultured Desulfovibrio sp. TaxID=167968 RepID=UPI00258868CF|nr:hypothetical protein [uncultured Desulfovibrio sp.]